MMTPNLFSQTDSIGNRRQIEFSGVGFQVNEVLLWNIGMGANFPCKKVNWYNNVSLSISKRDFSKKTGTVTSFNTLSIGRHYQLYRRRFFLSAGSNAGIYLSDWIAPSIGYSSKNFGLNIIPRIEIGFPIKNMVVAFGVHSSVGFGPYKRYYLGELEIPEGNKFWSKYRFSGELMPYIRLLIK